MQHGGHQIVKTMHSLGAKTVYCVAGESYLPILDALVDTPDINVVTCRQESGVTFMAEAYGSLHGKPGIAMVTRGPGACNASIGVHTAMQASTPMILLVGLIRIEDRNKEAFQEFDILNMYGSLAKWVAVVDETERLPEYIARAWHESLSGRPGPVVLGLPEDVLFAQSDFIEETRATKVSSYNFPSRIVDIIDALNGASAPLILTGGSLWSDRACEILHDFCSRSHIPVVSAFRRQDIFNHNDKNYIGELGTSSNPDLIERFKKSDCVLVLNERMDEITTQSYTLFEEHQKIIHVHPSSQEFGKAYMPDIAVQSDIEPFLNVLMSDSKIDGRKWAAWRDDARRAYLSWTKPNPKTKGAWNGADMTAIFGFLQQELPNDTIVTTDAGNFSGWAQRYLRYGRPGRLLAPVSGAMGYAIPSAVAASIEKPDRLVVGICGDGGFMMSSQEVATAMAQGARPIIVVCNNSVYGTIKMHQDKHYPNRKSATDLTNPDFVKLAESYGAFAARIDSADDFPEIWNRAIESQKLSLIEIVQDPKQVTTRS